MKKTISIFLLLVSFVFVSGCFQSDSDDDLRTIPVTNNPRLIPNHGGQMPGMAGGASPR
jgi:hypothetical protein